MKINGQNINLQSPPFIIAEMSANHGGSIQRAKKTMLSAKENVRSIRPGYGISPKFLTEIIGKKVLTNVTRGQPVSLKNIDFSN